MAKQEKEKKVKIEFDPTQHGSSLAQCIKNASDAKLKMEGYASEISELKQKAKDELGVDGKMFNTQFAMYHKGTRERFESEKTEAVELYDAIFDN